MSDDEHTPPRGGAVRNGKYSKIDDRSLLERTADNAFQARHEVRELRKRVNEVLALHRPWHERKAPVVTAIALVGIFLIYSSRGCSSAPPEPPAGSSAHR